MPQPEFKEKIVFVGRDSLFVEGLYSALPGLEYIVEIPGCDSAVSVLQDASVQKRLGPGSNILAFKPASKLEFLAKQHDWNLLTPSAELNRQLENKISVMDVFSKTGLPMLAWEVLEPSKTSWAELTGKLGERIVAQTERGHAGSSSVVLVTALDFDNLEADRLTKFSRLLEGETWTVNAVATKHGTLSSRPFYQLQGEVICGIKDELGTCGNQHRVVSDDLVVEIIAHTKKFGDYIYSEGYRGWFGLDVLVVDGKIAGYIECNPRLTASVGIFTEMQVEAKQTSFIILHILEILNRDYDLDLMSEQTALLKGFSESHIFLYNPKEQPESMKQTWKPGIYSKDGDFIREGNRWSDIVDNEVLLRTRRVGSLIAPGKAYAVAITRGEIPNFKIFRDA